MAGTIRGRIDCRLNTGDLRNTSQAVFVNLYQFFSGTGGATAIPATWSIVASNYGKNSGVQGAGMDFYDGADYARMNAFFVLKMASTAAKPWDQFHLFQWAYDGSNFGADPGNPGVMSSNYGVSIASASGIGGTGNPWTGTTNNNGLDRKGAVAGVVPVWAAPGGGGTGFVVQQRTNSTGGAQATNREACTICAQLNTAALARLHIVADDDSFMIAASLDTGAYSTHYTGLVIPNPNLTLVRPYAQIYHLSGVELGITTALGSTAGSTTDDGGVAQRDGTQSRIFRIDRLTNVLNASAQPNLQSASTLYDEQPVPVVAYEATQYGYVGTLDPAIIRDTHNIASETLNAAGDRMVAGNVTTVAAAKFSMPWLPGQVPRSSVSRTGVNF